MQPYCIYAEAFAGPFRPLRAPEPPFTHKTPPFTQVLFLFDAFYGTISLRKSSSLCSYKTESEVSMKKRILALLLAFSMMLSLLPVSALADTGGGIGSAVYASNGLRGEMPDLRMNSNGKPDPSRATKISEGVYQGDGWTYEIGIASDTLTLKSGKYDFNYTFPGFRNNESTHDPSDEHLDCVNVVNIVVQQDATIVGGVFEEISLLNHGTVTNGLFRGADVKNNGTLNCLFKSKPFGIGYHSLTAADNLAVEVLLYSFGNTESFWSDRTIYFTGTPTLTVKVDNNPIQYINGEKHYGGLRPSAVSGYYTFTPKAGEDIVLNLQHYDTDLEMTPRGFPVTTGREPIYQDDDSSKPIIGYKGNGWKYENGTLTLESGEYDFSYTYPKNSTGTRHSNHVRCNVIVNEGAAITGGILNGNSLTNSGTVKDVLIAGGWITNNGTLSCLLSTLTRGNSFTRHTVKDVNGEYFFFRANYLSSGSTDQLYFTGTPTLKVKLLSNKEITCINGRVDYGGLRDPDEEGYQTFTPKAGEDVVLNREPYATDLVITEGGIPDTTGREPIYDSANNVIGCKGEGWKYENDTLTLESGSYDFSKNGLGQLAPDVKLVVESGATLTGGVFNEIPEGLTANDVQTISLNGSGSIEAVNGLSSAKWSKTLYAIKDSQVEIKADTEITNINGWDIGKFPGSSYPNGADDKTTVRFRMPNGPVVLNDTLYTLDIIRGTMLGNTSVSVPAGTELILEADEPAKNETFLGWTLSDESLLTKGTLNDPECKTITIKMNNASATAEAVFQKDTPAYTLTVTGGGLVNDKTSAVVEAGDEVCLTVGEMQDGMSFNYWDLPTALTKALTDSSSGGFSNKVESLTFTMPDLSEYTEDTRFTIRLDIRPAELPDDDDGPSVLGTMATVAVGGAAAGILVWQGVSLGVDSYLQLNLPKGVAVPANRRELVKLLWETAGKPETALPSLYSDVPAEEIELQKATRWAIDNGLVKPADETDTSRFDPDRSVSKYEVARAWFKVQQMLK